MSNGLSCLICRQMTNLDECVWAVVVDVLAADDGHATKMQISYIKKRQNEIYYPTQNAKKKINKNRPIVWLSSRSWKQKWRKKEIQIKSVCVWGYIKINFKKERKFEMHRTMWTSFLTERNDRTPPQKTGHKKLSFNSEGGGALWTTNPTPTRANGWALFVQHEMDGLMRLFKLRRRKKQPF